ncbi:ParE family toxin-like protein [Coleofasciculus chthonoplastes]|uniref:ParE family toxin-like protein n=1 Tax=Coleofasciculus chthonoplastes TaxID=64178 RepID=UPI0040640CC0
MRSHRRDFYALPETVQRQARKSYDLLKADPNHPSLNFKKVGKYWSARIGLSYRALAVEDGSDFIWVWIGDHDEYDRLIHRN